MQHVFHSTPCPHAQMSTTLSCPCCAFSGTAWCTATAAGRAGESYNEDVLQTARPKYSRAAGLSVPLSFPCKQWTRQRLSKNTWDSFPFKPSPLLCLLTGPSARNAFLNSTKCWDGLRTLRLVVFRHRRMSDHSMTTFHELDSFSRYFYHRRRTQTEWFVCGYSFTD